MSKNKKKINARKKKQAQVAAAAQPDRRDILKLARNGALGAAALGGVSWWALSGIRATAAEMDLTKVGNGQPTIVQIHDPQCALCTELQRETRKALKCFDDGQLQYLVASIRTEEGARFAAARGLPHVTLVLMDGEGGVHDIVRGVHPEEALKPRFEALAALA
ncbi:MAG: hypothetical protein AAGG72_08405 [Pseudomonadota bacterium]